MSMKYSLFSLPWIFAWRSRLRAASLCRHVSDIWPRLSGGGWHRGNHSDVYPTWQLLAAIRFLSPEAPASFKTICLSFTANWFVLGWIWLKMLRGEYAFWQMRSTWTCTPTREKRAGAVTPGKGALGACGWISRLCDEPSSLNKKRQVAYWWRHFGGFQASWFDFLTLKKHIKLSLLLLSTPSGSSLTKAPLFTVFGDSCLNAFTDGKALHAFLIQLPKQFPVIKCPKQQDHCSPILVCYVTCFSSTRNVIMNSVSEELFKKGTAASHESDTVVFRSSFEDSSRDFFFFFLHSTH